MRCGETLCMESEFAGRQFLTAEEKIEKLQDYAKWLDNESKGVKEAVAKLKKAS